MCVRKRSADSSPGTIEASNPRRRQSGDTNEPSRGFDESVTFIRQASVRSHLDTAGLTETLSCGGAEETPLLAARAAVAILKGGQRGAGGAVGLGGTGAGLAGRMAAWKGHRC